MMLRCHSFRGYEGLFYRTPSYRRLFLQSLFCKMLFDRRLSHKRLISGGWAVRNAYVVR